MFRLLITKKYQVTATRHITSSTSFSAKTITRVWSSIFNIDSSNSHLTSIFFHIFFCNSRDGLCQKGGTAFSLASDKLV